ncbi:hypothetical protein PHSC3_000054 [Chlamydiales bacterium STE3]|nr:hypothetical protein PHSC3_000054 [Chlamydiales bacterium STE3]
MQEDDPVAPLLEQIASLLKFVQESAKKPINGPLDPSLKKRLEVVEDLVEKFREVTVDTLNSEGIDVATVAKKIAETPDQIAPIDRRLLQKSTELSLDTILLRKALQSAKTIGNSSQSIHEQTEEKASKKTVKARQKKFKKMGGNSKWMPL